ncbi:Holliday junction resolvase RuvX [Corynebacterium diphtheriae]|uniref:Holliday junction resolvase RuvX n=1 Tax=Corynebacterium diphtheriae TaxID=1717 RepID=UPI0009D321A8|nr:Holliday junction resolvase RuvX [Corynebacterium diphtheriae]MBG9316048.1 Holliday junction resolvase RuvX [Corynebacterium diphtheriae bv. mitis]OMO47886.1 Holliday junction resolvase RuvX [Corynebacterium diphtheriae]OMO48932.1 Holliday junction resolvase RuvX [Corynebacterium diphtheriae]RKW84336.1 Holliday junction resolvase RuvX [Corynebacterium diphtheriae]RKX07315.1 Holliday junction resolvase RuvX [Corynebacterium diphtheriae]
MVVQPDIPGDNDPGMGRRLGVDVGTVRIGLAMSDSGARMAMPFETFARETGLKDSDKRDIDRIAEVICDNHIVEVVVGLPRDLKGNGSKSVKHAKDVAFRIRRRMHKNGWEHVAVKMADERLTTVVATQALRASGVSEKKGRRVVDQAAAVEILQSWLDARNNVLENRTIP